MHLENYEYESFLQQHTNQLSSSGVPEHFWHTLFKKLSSETFDVGNHVSLLKIEYDDDTEYPTFNLQVTNESGIDTEEPDNIFLIDHAWTFRVEDMYETLMEQDKLSARLREIIGLSTNLSKELLVESILDKIWRYSNHYSIGNAATVEDRMPVWYVMDEVGCAVIHHDAPNVRLIPFYYLPENITFTLMFPVVNLKCGDIITRDFAEGISEDDDAQRKAFLLPWREVSFLHDSYDFNQVSDSYFLDGHDEEQVDENCCNITVPPKQKQLYKVYAEYEFVQQYLTDPKFVLCDSENEADILWYTRHFKSFNKLRDDCFVNQFPYEYILTLKDLLSITCRSKNVTNFRNGTLESNPTWLPTTYNLRTELVPFISNFQRREKLGLDNHWIVKPFNLARGLDTHITSNLTQLVRLAGCGSKIAQKYIERPILFHRDEISGGDVKFDIRYVLLLKSVSPLRAYAYRSFFLRFANRPFHLGELHAYERHFTVMNYKNPGQLKHMRHDEFISRWNGTHATDGADWETVVEPRIFAMLRDMFECATSQRAPRGVMAHGQCRALYAVDLMLERGDTGGEIQPKLLEVNYTPDCKRACEYYPEFYNDIFKLLFLDVENDNVFATL